MKVHRTIEEIPKITKPVLTLGTFDGVHLGHQEIISFLKEHAERVGGETVVLTFHPHPRTVLHPDDHNLVLIQSLEDRIKKLEDFGVDHLILFPFTQEFSRLSATDFVRQILVNQLNVKVMTIGYNHHFGRNREGSLDLLQELGNTYDFEVVEIPAFRLNEKSVSSTKIRSALIEGDIEQANTYLGKPFSFMGRVIRGNQIGTTIGFPTANIQPLSEIQVIPKNGVYAVRIGVDRDIYGGMCNIGNRPTVTENGERRIEIHIFDFNKVIYESDVRLYFIDHIRDENQFDSLEALKEQLKADEMQCRELLGSGSSVGS